MKFLRSNTYSVPFNTLFDLSESLASLIRNLIFNRADYQKLMVPEKFNETWESTLSILDQVFGNPEISEFKNNFEKQNKMRSHHRDSNLVKSLINRIAHYIHVHRILQLQLSQMIGTDLVIAADCLQKYGRYF